MTCENLTLSEFAWVQENSEVLVALFYRNGEDVREAKYALEMINNTLNDLSVRVCMVNVAKNSFFIETHQIGEEETPKVILFIGGNQNYGFSIRNETGQILSSQEITREIEERLERILNS